MERAADLLLQIAIECGGITVVQDPKDAALPDIR